MQFMQEWKCVDYTMWGPLRVCWPNSVNTARSNCTWLHEERFGDQRRRCDQERLVATVMEDRQRHKTACFFTCIGCCAYSAPGLTCLLTWKRSCLLCCSVLQILQYKFLTLSGCINPHLFIYLFIYRVNPKRSLCTLLSTFNMSRPICRMPFSSPN